jgi:hypothetical protein
VIDYLGVNYISLQKGGETERQERKPVKAIIQIGILYNDEVTFYWIYGRLPMRSARMLPLNSRKVTRSEGAGIIILQTEEVW